MSYRSAGFCALALALGCGTRGHPNLGGEGSTLPVDDNIDVVTHARDDVAGGGTHFGAVVDGDGDGLDDEVEARIAHDYLPFLSTHPDDNCPLSGLAVRVHPHPQDPALVSVVYSRLYERDCGVDGIGAHVGDNEAFGVTVDPRVAAPAGIISIVAVSHQGTVCERDTKCGQCPGLDACDTGDKDGQAFPIVYASKDKHASAVQLAEGCSTFGSCLDRCEAAPTSTELPMVNVGEPGHPLVSDLTTQGFITAANGWTEADEFHFDPWSDLEFGTAGKPSGDFVDDAFVAPACSLVPTQAIEPFVAAEDHVVDGPLCAAPAAAGDVVEPVHLPCALEVDNSIAPPPSPSPPALLHVVSWNIRIGHDHAAVLDHLVNDPALASADVLLLEEVGRGDGETVPAGLDEARDIALALGMNYAYAVEWDHRFVDAAPAPKGEHGDAVLSRFPIGNLTQLRHTPAHDWWGDKKLLGGRTTLGATLDVGGTSVRVYAGHLDTRPTPLPDDGPRAAQGAEIRADAGRAGRPAVVVAGGDFNTWTCNPVVSDCTVAPKAERVVQDFLVEEWRDGTAGFTGKTSLGDGFAPQRLDWLFYRGTTAVAGEAVDVDGSDHFPIAFDLALP